MPNNNIQLTPFEKAEMNRTIYKARMALCESVQDMVSTMLELEAMIADSKVGPATDMYDDEMIADMQKESESIERTLVNIALLMESQGVSA